MADRIIDTGPWGQVSIRTASAATRTRVWLDVSSLHVEMDEGTAGALLDALAESLRTIAAPHSGDTEQRQ